MKRIILSIVLIGMFLFGFTISVRAQERTEDSIKNTLQLLGEKLERYGKVRVTYGIQSPDRVTYQHFDFLGFEGCLFRYRIGHQEVSSNVRFEKALTNAHASGYSKWSVDLSDIDDASIEVRTKKGWKGGYVNYRIAGGNMGVKCDDCYGPNPNAFSTGGFAVSDTRLLEMIASDLKAAVCLCRKQRAS